MLLSLLFAAFFTAHEYLHSITVVAGGSHIRAASALLHPDACLFVGACRVIPCTPPPQSFRTVVRDCRLLSSPSDSVTLRRLRHIGSGSRQGFAESPSLRLPSHLLYGRWSESRGRTCSVSTHFLSTCSFEQPTLYYSTMSIPLVICDAGKRTKKEEPVDRR